MKKLLGLLIVCTLALLPKFSFGQAPGLGSAAGFALFSTIGAVTNTGPSQIAGDVGTNNGAFTGFGNVNGNVHVVDATSALCATDVLTVYNQVNGYTPSFVLPATFGSGDTLIDGVYRINSAATLNGNLVLNAQGNTNAVFVIQIQGAFSANTGSRIVLINGAQASNVFWKAEDVVDLAAGTVMKGTIIAHNAAINLNAGDSLEGRALAISGAITVNNIRAYTPVTSVLTGPIAPDLASVACYALFSASGAVANSGATNVTGDVGTNVDLTTGYTSTLVSGVIHPIPDASTATCAIDLHNVWLYLNSLPVDIGLMLPATFGNNLVLTPHTYLLNAATVLTDTLYLDAEGNADAVFVIKINGAFDAVLNSRVILINGAKAKNVYWKVEGAVTIEGNAIFNGTIVCNNAAILINGGALINGRALTTTGSITTTAMTIIANTVPVTGAILGISDVYIGATVALTDHTPGGLWFSSNGRATVTGGIVTGVSSGLDTISYVVTNLCGSDTAYRTVSVHSLPDVCVGTAITLADTATGGIWSSSNSNATVVGGIVTGITAGTDTIRFVVNNSCSSDTAYVVIIIKPLPFAGSIAGATSVCIGANITVSDTAPGGVWSLTNPAGSIVAGVVTGVSSGTDTVLYVVTNSCGIDTASTIINVSPLPFAGSIAGSGSVCAGEAITLTDGASGGVWSSVSTAVATIDPLGDVSGLVSGTSVISYTVTNSCGTDVASVIITVNPIPFAGTIGGSAIVCAGAVITLTDAATGGTWSSVSTGVATVSSGGVVSGVLAGTSLISYAVTNMCGTDVTTIIATVNALPVAGSIVGSGIVCAGALTSLTDLSAGGTWSSVSTGIASVGLDGTVSGISAGNTIISYTVVNSCGTDAVTLIVTVNPLPLAGTIAGGNIVCMGSSITLTDPALGGNWSVSNSNATVVGGVVTGSTPGADTILYTVVNSCGSSTATQSLTINLLPNAGTISGASSVCVGSFITLTDATPGGVWHSGNGDATVVGGVVTGITAGTDLIGYMVTNVCGTATATAVITINALPSAGVITY